MLSRGLARNCHLHAGPGRRCGHCLEDCQEDPRGIDKGKPGGRGCERTGAARQHRANAALHLCRAGAQPCWHRTVRRPDYKRGAIDCEESDSRYSAWPEHLDDVGESVRTLFETPRSLPPGCSIRAYWLLRAKGRFSDGTTEAGIASEGTVTVSYSSDDPSRPEYEDRFEVMPSKSGFWPVAESGPDPTGMEGDLRKFYLLGQALVRRVGALGR